MAIMTDPATLIEQPAHVNAMRRAVETVADGISPLVDLYRPYVTGLAKLPRDGRFLLVGNHTQAGVEGMLIPYLVRREIDMRVRPLVDRGFGKMPRPVGDLLAACGATVGAPESARELMRHGEPVLVFPGGSREIAKFKGEEYTLRWEGRAGFARLAVENDYPIVPVALVGGDDVYRTIATRDSHWGRISQAAAKAVLGRGDTALPLMHGVGPTLVPRPQRMYVEFGEPISTTAPAGVDNQDWVAEVRQQTSCAVNGGLTHLLDVRAGDPYRALNPLAWSNAAKPSGQ